jgi:hypothetical protein
MTIKSPTISTYQALSHSPVSTWKGGLELININGQPVLKFLLLSEMNIKEVFQWLFGIGKFRKVKIQEFLSQESRIFEIRTLLFSETTPRKQIIEKNIRNNLFRFVERHAFWEGHTSKTTSLADKICTPNPPSQIVQKTGRPISDLLNKAYLSTIEPLISTQLGFLKNDFHNLIEVANSSPNNPKTAISDLVHGILGDSISHKQLSMEEGREMIASILFLLDNKPSLLTEKTSLEEIENLVTAALKEKRALLLDSSKKLWKDSGVYTGKNFQEVLLPLAVASILLRPDGTINLGLTSRLKRNFFPSSAKSGPVREISHVLYELENDPTLVEKIKNFPLPVPGTAFDKAIHVSLQIPEGIPITKQQTQLICLATILSWWRQGTFGNCYAVSYISFIKETSLHWILDDLREICENGCISRTIGPKSFDFPVFFRLLPIGSTRKIEATQDRVNAAFALPTVQNACAALQLTPGNEREELFHAAKAVCIDGKWTLLDAFEWIRREKELPHETFQTALQYVDAMTQSSLLRLCENGMTSMLIPPPSVQLESLLQVKYLNAALFTTLSLKANERGLTKSASAIPSVSIPIPSTKDDSLENQAFRTIPFLEKLEMEIKSCSPSTASCLDRLRVAFCPPDSTHEHDGVFVLCEQNEKGFFPIDNEKLGILLKDILASIAKNVGDNPELVDGISTSELASEFSTLFSHFSSSYLHLSDVFLLQQKGEVRFSPWVFSTEWLLNYSDKDFYKISKSSIQEIYFSSPPRHEEINLENGKASLISLLKTSQSLRNVVGEDPHLTLMASMKGHELRFLPNHPSLIRLEKNTAPLLDDLENQGTAILSYSPTEFPTIKNLLSGFTKTLLPLNDIVNCSFETSKTLREAIDKWKNSFIDDLHRPLSQEEEDHITSLLLRGLIVDGQKEYHDPFVHFADTNWTRILKGNLEKIHLCFWFNPIKMDWQVVCAPEKGTPHVDSAFSVIDTSFFSYSLPQADILTATKKNKYLLTLTGKTRRRLIRLEDAFLESSSLFQDHKSSLSLALRQNLLSEPLPHHPATLSDAIIEAKKLTSKKPTTPQEALLHCRKLQFLFHALKRLALRELAPNLPREALKRQGIEVRTQRFGAHAKELQLLDNPAAFKDWVVRLDKVELKSSND